MYRFFKVPKIMEIFSFSCLDKIAQELESDKFYH